MNKINAFTGKYRFLSNFYPIAISYEGNEYASVEHGYQAAKALNVSDRAKFRANITAGEAKRLGRRIKIRPDWEKVKIEIMKNLLHQKFHKHEDLKQRLIDTKDAILEEGNDWGDTFWGIVNGKGQNLLGKLLMQIRSEIVTNKNDI
jgi:hypothetical protein